MAKIWVKGYTKSDGTKVKGYYKETSGGVNHNLTGKALAKKEMAGWKKASKNKGVSSAHWWS
jgi:hypothetical protein